jgi:hypothetical protein
VRDTFRFSSKLKSRSEVKQIEISGKIATVSVTAHQSGMNRRANNHFSVETTGQDTWKYTSNGWKLTGSHISS